MQWFVSTALLSIVSYTMHSSVRPTAYFMLRRVKLWRKLPIWPVLLKLWMSLYFFFFVGTFFSTLFEEKPESRDCLFAHELMWYICLYRSNGPGPAPCPLCKWKNCLACANTRAGISVLREVTWLRRKLCETEQQLAGDWCWCDHLTRDLYLMLQEQTSLLWIKSSVGFTKLGAYWQNNRNGEREFVASNRKITCCTNGNLNAAH